MGKKKKNKDLEIVIKSQEELISKLNDKLAYINISNKLIKYKNKIAIKNICIEDLKNEISRLKEDDNYAFNLRHKLDILTDQIKYYKINTDDLEKTIRMQGYALYTLRYDEELLKNRIEARKRDIDILRDDIEIKKKNINILNDANIQLRLDLFRIKYIEQLTPFKYELIKQDNCSICLEEWVLEDNIIMLKCKHYFHKNCLKFITNGLCPICRVVFKYI